MEAGKENYYSLLGVDREASTDQIKETYRELARIFHPDSNFYDEIIEDAMPAQSMDKFKLITAAYNTLIDPKRREEYDQTLPLGSLKDWDHRENENTGDRNSGIYRKYNPSAFGTFGQTQRQGEYAFESAQSMADIISSQRSIYRRILSIFGF